MTRFCVFQRIFKIFSKLKKSETPKMRFYEQVWSVWWLRYSKKLTYHKFEVSDFWNFEKIFKIRLKRQKRVIFTKMLFSLRQNRTSSVNLLVKNLYQIRMFLTDSLWVSIFWNYFTSHIFCPECKIFCLHLKEDMLSGW